MYTKDVELFLLLRFILDREGHSASLAIIAFDLLHDTLTDGHDAVILDCVDGYEYSLKFCRALKHPDRPSISVAALIGPEPAGAPISLLNAGANVILMRPFDPAQLVRFLDEIHSTTGAKTRGKADRELRYKDIEVNFDTMVVRRAGCPVRLSPLHFRLLSYLVQNPETIHSREDLIAAGWPSNSDVEPRTVDIHMSQIRRALKIHGSDAIRTARSAGYALEVEL